MKNFHAALALLSVFLGCAAGSSDDQDTAGADIVGGSSDDQHGSVALIRFVKRNDDGTEKPNNCTGSLVAPQIVLTAAHCVVPASGEYSGWKVSFEATTTQDGGMVNPIAVTKAIAHPDFDRLQGFGAGDVALLFLERAPAGLEPMPIVDKLDQAVGDTMTFIGYGATDTTPDGNTLLGGNDRRRQVTVQISAISDTFLEYKGTQGLCGGDSGGPTVMNIGGVEKIVATNDLTGVGCKANGASLRIDEASSVRDFLSANIPGVSPGTSHPSGDDGEGGAPPSSE
jgi:secreted trypsin-like serine protease